MYRLKACFLVVMSIGACAPLPDLPAAQTYTPAALATLRYKAVLIAGDASVPVFDNAVQAVAARLTDNAANSTQRLSATPRIYAKDGVQPASLDHVLDAIATMRPGAGEGCFVFATSHGAKYRGLMVGSTGQVLQPPALDDALVRGCGNAPTVIVISGCFTGGFAAAPVTRANRVILTAARADRPSFGCGAGQTYTFYDQCLLAAAELSGTWQRVHTRVQECVGKRERQANLLPSEPQAWFGAAVPGLPLPGRTLSR